MDANQKREAEQIKTFVSVTGSDEDIARQYLEASVWDLNNATANYYASDNAKSNYNPTPPKQRKPTPAPVPVYKPSPGVARIATLGDLSSEPQSDPQNNLYAGGKQSGIQLQGRPEDQNRGLVDKIFQKQSQEAPEPEPAPKSFGTGYKLGSAPDAPVIPVNEEKIEQVLNPNITITFYRQGFVVDDGPLRKYDADANAAFLKDIDNGIVPMELQQKMQRGATAANVTLVNKKQVDYEETVAPKPKVQSFTGTAQKLGDSSSLPAVESKPVSPSVGSGKVAKIQIRLGAGGVLRGEFGMDQTIRDIRNFIDANKPQSRSYELLIPYPRAVLANLDQTIAEADLNNACIAQKFT